MFSIIRQQLVSLANELPIIATGYKGTLWYTSACCEDGLLTFVPEIESRVSSL